MENLPSRVLRKKEYEDRMNEYKDHKKELHFEDYKTVSYYWSYEPSISYVLLSQAMRQNKQINLLGSDYKVVRPWDCPVSRNLKIYDGRMYTGDGRDVSHFFWDEIYWLFFYFNQTYGLSDFDRYNIRDFITFGYNDNTCLENLGMKVPVLTIILVNFVHVNLSVNGLYVISKTRGNTWTRLGGQTCDLLGPYFQV